MKRPLARPPRVVRCFLAPRFTHTGVPNLVLEEDVALWSTSESVGRVSAAVEGGSGRAVLNTKNGAKRLRPSVVGQKVLSRV